MMTRVNCTINDECLAFFSTEAPIIQEYCAVTCRGEKRIASLIQGLNKPSTHLCTAGQSPFSAASHAPPQQAARANAESSMQLCGAEIDILGRAVTTKN
jgi:hypothetical protein